MSASAGDHMDMYGDCTTSGTEDGRNVVVTAKEECGKTSMQATKISREIHRQGRAGLLVCARVDIGVDGGGMQSGGAILGGRHLGQGVLGRRGNSPGSSFAPKFTSVLGGRSRAFARLIRPDHVATASASQIARGRYDILATASQPSSSAFRITFAIMIMTSFGRFANSVASGYLRAAKRNYTQSTALARPQTGVALRHQ